MPGCRQSQKPILELRVVYMSLLKQLSLLKKYRSRIEEQLKNYVSQMGEKTALRDACEYALLSGGKRLRPMLVMMVADALGNRLDVTQACLSVEFFHTASLIADDLPCMDNDDERRSRPSLHKAFDEGVALLASYTFIASGYEGIYKNGRAMKSDPQFAGRADEATLGCLEIATRCAGIFGATNGQFLDLYPPDRSLATIEKIILQKTVTLFQICFVFGWLFGGGPIDRLKEVEQTAHHLGMAFQIADDLQDSKQDATHECEINIADAMGRTAALALFQSELTLFEQGLKDLKLWNEEFEEVVGFLQRLV
jgi:geranylgeranyl diphosphate synthase type II